MSDPAPKGGGFVSGLGAAALAILAVVGVIAIINMLFSGTRSGVGIAGGVYVGTAPTSYEAYGGGPPSRGVRHNLPPGWELSR